MVSVWVTRSLVTRIAGRVAGLRAVRLIVCQPRTSVRLPTDANQLQLHPDMAGDEAEPCVEPVRVEPRSVARQLDQAATFGSGDVDRVANQLLAKSLAAMDVADADCLDQPTLQTVAR